MNIYPDGKHLATATVEQTRDILDNAPIDISLTVKPGKPTKFYFDVSPDNSKKDGTYNGLTDITDDPCSGNVYINTSGLPAETS